ncbi:uncharacterized protein NPIL_282361 [Nephila pilipes]|uniref:Uncharacterized protein n=1 Tax=Nephila pilipes TaxID=299642 RepID=A0A8X6U1H7_NEPPI|nr:uncharacterized protein NPIL_282361 [Nephila pilipes]
MMLMHHINVKHHIKKIENSYPKSIEILNSALYVDDLYFGRNNVDELFEFSTDAVSIFKHGRLNLRKLRSNSKDLEKMWMHNGLNNADVVGEHQLKILELN